MCTMLAYLLSGALHGIYHLDVTNPSGKPEITSLVGSSAGHPEQKGLAEHHCHGCFSVAVPQPVLVVTADELLAAPNTHRQPALVSVVPATDPPPPKYLI